MNISLAISQLFPEADPLTDFLVSDQGDGQFIADWNLPDPQPTEDELRVAWEAHLNKPVQPTEDEMNALAIMELAELILGG